MGLDKMVADLLEEHLGEYVENISGDTINVSVFSGKVELDNLILKRTALQKLGLPLYVETGCIQHMKIDIPWTGLKSEPVIARIDGVYLLATHAKPEDWDPEQSEQKAQENKAEALADWEVAQEEPEEEDYGFTERLAQTIMRNLQICITNVHIRYEHPTPGGCYAVGMTFSELKADTTDCKWTVKFTKVKDAEQPVFKVAKLQDLALYVDPTAEPLHQNPHTAISHLSKMIAGSSYSSAQHTPPYVIPPVHVQLSAELQHNDRPEDKVPRLAVCASVSAISFDLDSFQYAAVVALLCDWDRTLRHQQYARYRPARVLKTAKQRWAFALAAVSSEVSMRMRSLSWEHLKRRGQRRRGYIWIYKRLQRLDWDAEGVIKEGSPEDANLHEQLTAVEHDYPAADLIWWRSLARVEILAEAEANKQRKAWNKQQKKKRKKMRAWHDFSDGPETGDVAPSFQMSSGQLQELYSAIDYQPRGGDAYGDGGEGVLTLPGDYDRMVIVLQLHSVSFGIKDQPSDPPMVSGRLSKTTAGIVVRPAGLRFDCAIEEARIEQAVAGCAPGIPLVQTSASSSSGFRKSHSECFEAVENCLTASLQPIYQSLKLANRFAQLQFETTDHDDGGSDTRLTARFSTLKVFYARCCIEAVMQFLQGGAVAQEFEYFQQLASQHLASISTDLDLLTAARELQSHSMVLDIEVQTPLIALPQDGCVSANTPMLLLNLGRFSCETATVSERRQLHDADGADDVHGQGVVEDEAYDAYKLELSDTSMILLTDSSNWSHESGASGEVIELLAPKHPAHIELAVRRCVVETSEQFPALCFDMVVHPIEITLLPEYIEKVAAVVVQLPPQIIMQGATQPNDNRSELKVSHVPRKKKVLGNIRHLSANLVLQRLTVEVAAPDTPLMTVDVSQVVVDLTHNEYDSLVAASLGSLSVVDLYAQTSSQHMEQLARSGHDSVWQVKLSIAVAAPQTANAEQLCAQTLVQLTVGDLALGLNHLTAAAWLQLFVQPLMPLVLEPHGQEPPDSPTGLSRNLSGSSTFSGSPGGLSRNLSMFSVGSGSDGHFTSVKAKKSGLAMLPMTKRFAKKWKASKKKDLPVMKLEASLASVGQTLRREEEDHVVCSLQISKVALSLSVHANNALHLAMSVGGLQLNSSLPEEMPHHTILKSSPHSATNAGFDLRFKTTGDSPSEDPTQKCFANAELCVGPLELVLLHTVMEELYCYGVHSPLTMQVARICAMATGEQQPELGAAEDEGAVAEEASKESAGDFCQISVSIESPMVIVPRSSASREFMSLKCDSFSISNELEMETQMDVISIQMCAASLATTNSGKGIELADGTYGKLVQDTTLAVQLRRSIDSQVIAVKAMIPQILIHASQWQLEVVMATLFENMAEHSEFVLESPFIEDEDTEPLSSPSLSRHSSIVSDGASSSTGTTVSISLELELDAVTLNILDYNVTAATTSSIAKLELGKAAANFTSEPGGRLSASVSMHSLTLYDSRSQLDGEALREPVVCTDTSSGANEALSVTLNRDAGSEAALAQLHSGGLLICLCPDTIEAWLKFAISVAQNISVMPTQFIQRSGLKASSRERAESMPMPGMDVGFLNVPQDEEPVSPSGSSSQSVHLDVNVGDITLKLPSAGKKALVLQVQQCAANVDISDADQTIDGKLVVSVYEADPDAADVHTFDILKPHELSLHLKKTLSSENGWLQLQVAQLFLSPQEVALLFQIHAEFEPLGQLLHDFQRQQSGKLHRSTSGNAQQSPQSTQLSPVQRGSSPLRMFEVAGSSILLTIVDTSFDPILDLQISGLRALVQTGGVRHAGLQIGANSLEVTLDFELDSCRRSMSAFAWEPVLEPVKCMLSVETQSNGLQKSTAVDLKVADKLNLVVCADMISCLGNLAAATSPAAVQTDLSCMKAAGCKLRILNRTSGTLLVSDDKDQSVKVSSLQYGELAMQSSVLCRSSEEDSCKAACVSITIGDPAVGNWGQLLNFDTSLPGQRIYRVTNANTGQTARIVTCVHLEARTKLVTISSEVVLNNNCSLPVKVRIRSISDEEVALGTVKHGAHLALPFGVLKGQLEILPQMCSEWRTVLDLSATSSAARDQDLNRASAELVEYFEEASDEELVLCTPPCEAQIGDNKHKPVRLRLFFTPTKLYLYGDVFGTITKHSLSFCHVKQLSGDQEQLTLEFSSKSKYPSVTLCGFANPKRTFRLMETSVASNSTVNLDKSALTVKHLIEFGLENDDFVDSFQTASGELVLSTRHLCYRESQMFGDPQRTVVPLDSIRQVEKTKKNWVIPCIIVDSSTLDDNLEMAGFVNPLKGCEEAFVTIERLRTELSQGPTSPASPAAQTTLEVDSTFHAASSVCWPVGSTPGKDGVCVLATWEDQRLQKRGFKTAGAPFEITLHSPVTVKNMLDLDIKFELFDQSDNAVACFYNEACATQKLCTVKAADPSRPLWMSFGLDDGEMIARFELDTSGTPGSDHGSVIPVTLSDAYQSVDGQQCLHISVEVLVRPLGAGIDIVLFAPFLIRNNCGIDLVLDAKAGGCRTVVPAAHCIMFALPPGSEESEIVVASAAPGNGAAGEDLSGGEPTEQFCKPFSVDALSSGCISIPGERDIHLAVSIAAAQGSADVKVIELKPRFKMVNETEFHLAYSAGDCEGVQGTIPPLRSEALTRVSFDDMLLMKIQLVCGMEATVGEWSAAFAVQDPVNLVLYAPTTIDDSTIAASDCTSSVSSASGAGRTVLVAADVVMEDSSMVVVMRTSGVDASYVVKNKSNHYVKVCQTGSDDMQWQDIEPAAQCDIVWHDPLAPHELRVRVGEDWSKTVHLDVVEEHKEESEDFQYDVRVGADGTHFLYIEPSDTADSDISAAMVQASWSSGPVRTCAKQSRKGAYDIDGPSSPASTGAAFGTGSGSGLNTQEEDGAEAEQSSEQTENFSVLTMSIAVEGFGISMINSIPSEVFYVYLSKILLALSSSETFEGKGEFGIELTVQAVQIDNMLQGAPFPVLFSVGDITDEDARPAVHLSVVKKRKLTESSSSTVHEFSYFSLLVQQMYLSMDEASLSHMYRLVSQMAAALPPAGPDPPPMMLYFATLELQPLFLTVSTDHSCTVEVDPGLSKWRIGKRVAKALGMKKKSSELPEIDLAALRVNALKLQALTCNEVQLAERLSKHLSDQFMRQVFVLIGSASALGNPAGLFNSLSTGVVDFIYEPAQGAIQSPAAFGKGMMKGSSSLAGNTTSGLFDSTSKITGSIGAGFALASGDDAYVLEVQERERRARAGGASAGAQEAAKALGAGFKDGIQGLVSSPADGAAEDGVGGFLKGFGKGIAGIVVKPVSGIFQAAGLATGAVKSGIAGGHPGNKPHIRLRRVLAAGGVIQQYDAAAAKCQMLLRTLKCCVADVYVMHAEVTDGLVVLSDNYLVLFKPEVSDGVVPPKAEWKVPNSRIASVVLSEKNRVMIVELDGKARDHCQLSMPVEHKGSKLLDVCDQLCARFPHIVLSGREN